MRSLICSCIGKSKGTPHQRKCSQVRNGGRSGSSTPTGSLVPAESKDEDEEIQALKNKCLKLQEKIHELEITKQYLESRLQNVQKNLNNDERVIRNLQNKRLTELCTLRQEYENQLKKALKLLNMRMQLEINGALRSQKDLLKSDFKIKMNKILSKNLQFAMRFGDIEEVNVNKTLQEPHKSHRTWRTFASNGYGECDNRKHGFCGPIKCKYHTGSVKSTVKPYCVGNKYAMMKDHIGQMSLDSSSSAQNHKLLSSLYHQQQYYQGCGGVMGLETLLEAESEEEGGASSGDERSHTATVSSSLSSPRSCDELRMISNQLSLRKETFHSLSASTGNLNESQQPLSLTRYKDGKGSNTENKISVLESIIRQLQDELRECRDQNELLEFRLLEMQESAPADEATLNESSVLQATTLNDGGVGSSYDKSLPHIRRQPKEDGDCDSGNGHSNIVESRSSCSDCSESLSFQESGIFDSQSTEEGLVECRARSPTSRNNTITIGNELVTLTYQIQQLLKRFQDSNDCDGKVSGVNEELGPVGGHEEDQEGDGSIARKMDDETSGFLSSPGCSVDQQASTVGGSKTADDKKRVNSRLCSDLQVCRQRMEEFERRLSQISHFSYAQNLEEKLNLLMCENERLVEEKSELEEADNDNRLHCQRLEEKVAHIEKKRAMLENQLGCERSYMEQLRMTALKLQKKKEELTGKLSNLEALLQSYERQNFELEESCVEMKCSIQIIANSIPGLALFYLWSLLRNAKLYVMHSEVVCYRPKRKEDSMVGTIGEECGNKLPKTVLQSIGAPQRKHKFLESFPQSERPITKRVKEDGAGEADDVGGGAKKRRGSWVQKASAFFEGEIVARKSKSNSLTCNSSTQTSYEEWSEFLQGFLQPANQEIDKLNTTLKKCEDEFMNEREDLIKSYEDQLFLKDTELASIASDKDKLEDKWNNLIKELETFALYLGKNLCGGENPQDCFSNDTSTSIISLGGNILEQFKKYEEREKELLNQIDILKQEISSKKGNSYDLAAQLSEENSKLQSMLKDGENAWSELQEEHEKLKHQLDRSDGRSTRAQETSILHERIEELEEKETHLKSMVEQMERTDSKNMNKIQQLRDEIQFLRNKCCQIQDDLDNGNEREAKVRAQLQNLTIRLKEAVAQLEEKDHLIENNEATFQAQIAKMKGEMRDLSETNEELECSSSMMKEEVQYLEKTLEATLEKVMSHERALEFSNCELKEKEMRIECLESQLKRLSLEKEESGRAQSLDNDMEPFVENQGGLHGVATEVKDVIAIIKNCENCDVAVLKLNVIVDKLIALIQTLTANQAAHMNEGSENGESGGIHRYESIESVDSKSVVQLSESRTESRPRDDEEERISSLQKMMMGLTRQIVDLEEALYIREKMMKESHLQETTWWRWRCNEKNRLIQMLATRIAHLSVTDSQGYFVDGIIKDIEKVSEEVLTKKAACAVVCSPTGESCGDIQLIDFSCCTLRAFLAYERRRVMDMLESGPGLSGHVDSTSVDFRVLRRISEDALLVSWSLPQNFPVSQNVSGYEISVNGHKFLRIPKANRHKAVLFGLNMEKPLQLSLRCTGHLPYQESTITYIA